MQISDVKNKSFGKIRNFLWPIHAFELKKLIPMFILFFLISFVYNVLRNLKVSLFMDGSSSFAELMPFLKLGAVLPGALFFTYVFTLLISRFTREHVFYIMLTGFMSYFALFLFVLYPNDQYLRLDMLADFLQANVFTNDGFRGFIAAIRYLNLTVFYVICEMWSVVVLSMMFWGFANEVTKVEEAKRFYAIFALGANSSGILSGGFGQIEGLSFVPVTSFYVNNEWIFLQLCAVLVIGMVVMYLFHWLNKEVFHLENEHIKLKAKEKLSLKECFYYLSKSRYLIYMVIIVVGYNVVYNLADNMWVYKIQEIYPNKRDANTYMNNITSIMGYTAVALALLLSGNVIRRFGWTIAALITPIVWLLTGMGFFSGLVLEKSMFFDVFSAFASNPSNVVLLLGSIQICLGRACKYTVFDEAKEIAFIPLPKENQRKGKAVVDGLASRFGKSGGSLILILLGLIGSKAEIIPYVSVIVFVVLIAWLYATYKMGVIVDKAISGDGSLLIEEEGILSEQNRRRTARAARATGSAVPQPN